MCVWLSVCIYWQRDVNWLPVRLWVKARQPWWAARYVLDWNGQVQQCALMCLLWTSGDPWDKVSASPRLSSRNVLQRHIANKLNQSLNRSGCTSIFPKRSLKSGMLSPSSLVALHDFAVHTEPHWREPQTQVFRAHPAKHAQVRT